MPFPTPIVIDVCLPPAFVESAFMDLPSMAKAWACSPTPGISRWASDPASLVLYTPGNRE
jgi:hypothetical protein